MSNLMYILKRLKSIDKKAMLEKINSIHAKTGKSRLYLLWDLQKCARKYGAGYMDYDLFEMYNLTPEQRNTYLTRERNNDLVVKYNNKAYFHVLDNKDEFNEVYKNYVKRDWIKVKGNPKESIIAFMEKHNEFMAKPVDGSCGHGIEKINIADYSSLEEVYQRLIEGNNNYELEEIIEQHPAVSAIYPDAINTVRVVTILKDGVVHVICAYFRIGNGKHVDNFNSGGMVAPVDELTGEVVDKAIDKKKNLYETHPLTGAKIKGFKFPDWNRAIEMCKEAAKITPQIGYVGWDVCFTPDGPMFVEGNPFPGHDIYQLPEHTPNKIGIMAKFNV